MWPDNLTYDPRVITKNNSTANNFMVDSMAEEKTTTPFDDQIEALRKSIEMLGKRVRRHVKMIDKVEKYKKEDRGEVIANLMLAYRHLEDARMRLQRVLENRG